MQNWVDQTRPIKIFSQIKFYYDVLSLWLVETFWAANQSAQNKRSTILRGKFCSYDLVLAVHNWSSKDYSF